LGSVGYIGVDLSKLERVLLIISGSLLAFWIFSIEAIPFYVVSALIIALRTFQAMKRRSGSK
jgi:hypothetical protein